MNFLSPFWYLQAVDNFLNGITMYRLVVYGLLGLSVLSVLFGFFDFLTYSGLELFLSLIVLLLVCFFFNLFLAYVFQASVNIESSVITALILFLILLPNVQGLNLLILIMAGVLAVGSKYFLAFRAKHIFNPVTIALVILGLFGFGNAFWWVGSAVLLPFVLVLGLLIVRKVRRESMFAVFVLTALVSTLWTQINFGLSVDQILLQLVLSSPLVFFGAVMLTEPLTTPARKKDQIIYGVLVGLLFGLNFSFGPFYSSPELTLVVGNIFSYAFSFRKRLILTLKDKKEIGKDIWEFVFGADKDFNFRPGEYMEWTLPIGKMDSRGNRRYFTIASSPTEKDILLGVKFNSNGSTFKKDLLGLTTGEKISANSLMGDFLLEEKDGLGLVFIAGGIGITPFRSMVKYLIDKEIKCSVVLFYTVKDSQEIVYQDVWQEGQDKINLRVVYVLTDKENVSPGWQGEVGFIDETMIRRYVPDWPERKFYLSGPNAMVEAYKKTLLGLGVSRKKIKTDYFPGF